MRRMAYNIFFRAIVTIVESSVATTSNEFLAGGNSQDSWKNYAEPV